VRFDGFAIVHVSFETLDALTLAVDHVSLRRGDSGTAAGRWSRCCSIHVAGFSQLMVNHECCGVHRGERVDEVLLPFSRSPLPPFLFKYVLGSRQPSCSSARLGAVDGSCVGVGLDLWGFA